MKVGVIKDREANYPVQPPFNPSVRYPEYPFADLAEAENDIYRLVRELFLELEMDAKNYGQASWNPLGELIKPGDRVLIKPNLVHHPSPGEGLEELITHGSIVRAICDYVIIALKGSGHITIGDAPLQTADFEQICQRSGLSDVVSFYEEQGRQVSLIDFRKVVSRSIHDGYIKESNEAPGDPEGYFAVDLGDKSRLSIYKDRCESFRVTNYDADCMREHHSETKNEYLISGSVVKADVIINIPKMKTHRKAGMTCALKNLVGINGSKDWLPHHRVGSKEEGGDEYLHPAVRKRLSAKLVDLKNRNLGRPLIYPLLFRLNQAVVLSLRVVPSKDRFFEGSWYGNETIPCTIADLNSILLYSDKTGRMTDSRTRMIFIVVDGIVGGEKDGPLHPTYKKAGLLVGGFNPFDVDLVCAQLMGFDPSRIPTIRTAEAPSPWPLKIGDITLLTRESDEGGVPLEKLAERFEPAPTWKGKIEKGGA